MARKALRSGAVRPLRSACLSLLCARRYFLGCELGGPSLPKKASAGFLLFLWAVYIGMSIARVHGLLG
eukprot:128904-Prymnesium_polylepis.2